MKISSSQKSRVKINLKNEMFIMQRGWHVEPMKNNINDSIGKRQPDRNIERDRKLKQR
jgi:hypothetical protein